MTQKIYPVIIQMNTKDVQIGSVKVKIASGNVIERHIQEHDVFLEDVKIQFKKGDFITKVNSTW